MPIQTRHPVAMAQQALVEPGGVRRPVHARASGRRTTGSSPTCSGSRTSGRPRLVRNYLEVLNAAFAGPGPVDVENDDYRVHNPLDVTDIVADADPRSPRSRR